MSKIILYYKCTFQDLILLTFSEEAIKKYMWLYSYIMQSALIVLNTLIGHAFLQCDNFIFDSTRELHSRVLLMQ